MGYTAARITPSATDPAIAFVACGSDFCRIKCPQAASSSLDIVSIWFTQPLQEGYQQFPVAALDQVPFEAGGESPSQNLGGFMFTITTGGILLARLDYDNASSSRGVPLSLPEAGKAIPRKIVINETTTKLAYTDKLRRLIVATNKTKEERRPPHGHRTVQSSIRLLNVGDNMPEIKQEEGVESPRNNDLATNYMLNNYERVYTILDWVMEVKGRPHHFLYLIF